MTEKKIAAWREWSFWRLEMGRKGFRERIGNCALFFALAAVAAGNSALAQTPPAILISSTATVTANGLSKVGKVVQDTCGNLYELENGGNLMEIPAAGGPAIYLANYGSFASGDGLLGGIAIDNKNNLYVDNKWNGEVIEIPSSNCVPNTGAVQSVLNNNSIGSVDGYWYDPGDVAADSKGNLFVVSNGFGGSGSIYEQTSPTTGAKVFGGSGIPQITSLAVDASDDVFFTTSGSGIVYEIPAASYGTSNPTAVISTGITTALGLSFDASGNLYIGDSGAGKIFKVPFAASGSSTTPSLQFGSMYLIADGLTLPNPLTISIDGRSFYFGGNTAVVYQQAFGGANLGAIAAGSNSSATIDIVFGSSATPGGFALYPSSGQFEVKSASCSAGTPYSAGSSCSEVAQFNPTIPGVTRAGLTVTDTSGAALGTLYLSGTGVGAGLTLDPGIRTSFGTGFSSPKSIAIDAAGDTFIADAGKNAVLEFAAGSSTAVSLGTGLSNPSGVAVDGAGNVFIADTGNNRIVEVPIVNGTLSAAAQSTLVAASDGNGNATPIAGTALNAPAGIAVGPNGDLYITDTGNGRVVYVPFNGNWNLAGASVPAASLTSPLATAVDPNGNLYVANSGTGQIYRLPAPLSQGIQQLVAVGYNNPSALALDASGSLFIVDQGNGSIVRLPNVGGSLDPNGAIEVGIGIDGPYGLAIDPVGNLYVSDATSASAYFVGRTSTSQAFGSWVVNTSGGPLAVQLESEGNLALSLATPYFSATGDTSDYAIGGSASNECTDGASIQAGSNCEVDATFTPTAAGSLSETLAFLSNAVNSSGFQIAYTGAGLTSGSTTTTLAITSPTTGMPFFGQPITLSATVASTSGTPSGEVVLLVDGGVADIVPVNGSGVAAFTLATGLNGGSHSLLAVYEGSASFGGSTSTSLILSIAKAPTTTVLAIGVPFTNPLSSLQGNTVTLTASISSTGVGIPTGLVSFSSGGTSLGTAPVLPGSGGTFEATYSTTSLPSGSDSIAATYAGDANYIGSASAANTVIIVNAAQVSATASGTSISSSLNKPGSITFTHTTLGGWSGLVGYSCLASSLPANARCVFSPGQANILASNSTTVYPASNVTLTITVNNPPQTPTAASSVWWLGGVITGLVLLFKRRSLRHSGWGWTVTLLAATLLTISAGGLAGCGGNVKWLTPKGTSTVTVYASADPYALNSSGGVNTGATQSCGVNPGTNQGDPTLAPCSQQVFTVNLTVQ